jgi:hypothetical protein
MSDKPKFSTITSLMDNFLQRYNLPKKEITEAYILEAAAGVLLKKYPDTARFMEARQVRGTELVLVASDPFLTQELRLKSLEIVAAINQVLGKTSNLTALRIVGR